MRYRLTQSSSFHFFGRDRKDVNYLDHNFDYYGRHSVSRRNASVYVKPLKETSDAVEGIDELVLTRGGIFSRLGVPMSKQVTQEQLEEHPPKEERRSLQRLYLLAKMPEYEN